MDTLTAPTTQDLVREFEENGFIVVPNALSPDEVASRNAAFDQHLDGFPETWAHFSESFIQTVDVLTHTSAFDSTIENPKTLGILQQFIGPNLAFEEISMMIRNPTERTGDLKGWHRDIIRDFDRRHEINAISVVFYLTDVAETDHCFSIIPGTHGPRLDMRPEDVKPGMERDAVGPAGSAFIFHARCIHAGRLKPNSRQRRTLHFYYGDADAPRTSEWTTIPERLALKHDPSLPPRLYDKARSTQIVSGTGLNPRDVDPPWSNAQMLMHLQRRANTLQPIA